MSSLPFFKKRKSAGRGSGAAGRLRLAAERLAGSRLALLKSFFLGITLTAVFYEVFPLPYLGPGRLLAIFDNSVSEVIVVLAVWAGWFLVLQAAVYRNEAKALRALSRPEVRATLAEGLADGRAESSLAQALAQARVRNPGDTWVARRLTAMSRLAGRHRAQALPAALVVQADIDAKKLDLIYAPVQIFIWAIPILGFIGTVIGIGDAIVELSRFVQSADPSGLFGAQMRQALTSTAAGLSVAFNTTLLALALVIPVMLAASLLQRAAEGLLLSLDELLLWEFGARPGASGSVEAAEGDGAPLPEWLGRVERATDRFAQQVDAAHHQLAGVQPLIKEFTERLLDSTDRGAKPAAAPREETVPAGRSRSGA